MTGVVPLPRGNRANRPPPPKTWVGLLAVSDKGAAKGSLGNLRVVLEHHPDWVGAFAYDERAERIQVMRPSPLDHLIPETARHYPRPFLDEDATRIAMWGDAMRLDGIEGGVSAPPDKWHSAVMVEARRKPFDPVRTYLDSLQWDGKTRLDGWLVDYLGVRTDDEKVRRYVQTVGAAWIISAVARTYSPGCKADCVLVIEGPQGIGKSTALATIAGREWFTDEVPQFGSKDAAMHVHGPWIIELAELDALRRSEVTTVKAFLSRSTDRFRPPYGRTEVALPRRCVFAATTNEDAYLHDTTGGRRFWPVKATRINVAGLRAARDQLWAEAVSRFRSGAPWHISESATESIAKDEQASRCRDDSWDAKVAAHVYGRGHVTVADVLEVALNVPTERQGQQDQNRVAHALKRLGWWRKQRRTTSGREWIYLPPTPEDDS